MIRERKIILQVDLDKTTLHLNEGLIERTAAAVLFLFRKVFRDMIKRSD